MSLNMPFCGKASTTFSLNTLRRFLSFFIFVFVTVFWLNTALGASPLPDEEVQVLPGVKQGTLLLGMASALTNPSKVHVIAPEKMKYIGQLPAGYSAQMLPLAQEGLIAIASTYYSRIYRGERTDVLELWDRATLSFQKELALPTTRALHAASRTAMAMTLDRRFILIQNATPASSFTVVDFKNWKVVGEIPDPGCFGIYLFPNKPSAFGSLCGDGKMAIFALDEQGNGKYSGSSEKLFDPENDPVYMFAETVGNQFIMVSFKGNVRIIDIQDGNPKLSLTFEIATGVEGNWRPGGYQPFAVDPKSGTLFVLMHKDGKEGSHKLVAEEIWAIDLASGSLLSRSPCEAIDTLLNIPGDNITLVGGEPKNDYLNLYEADPSNKFKLEQSYYENAGPWIPHLEVMQ